jgi:hypothetical protein
MAIRRVTGFGGASAHKVALARSRRIEARLILYTLPGEPEIPGDTMR